MNECQFSFYCDGRSDRPYNEAAWRMARDTARIVAEGKPYALSDNRYPVRAFDGVMWYHADYVDPYWADHYTLAYQIGRHRFYR